MKNCLRNTELAAKLESDGFVLVPFLNAEKVEKLKNIYNQIDFQTDQLFWSSSFFESNEQKKELSARVETLISENVDAVLEDFKTLGAGFLTKFPGQYSEMPIHQDWTVVDEEKFGSYTIWIALTDTTAENGALEVIPGSHRLSDSLRSPSLPVSFESLRNELRDYLQLLPMKAGEALIFNHALLHSSPANTSDVQRVAATFGFVPKDASLCMYYGAHGGKVKKFDMPDDMFIRYNDIRHKPLIGTLTKEFDYAVKEVTRKEMEETLGSPPRTSRMEPLFRNEANQSYFEKNGFVKIPVLQKAEIDELLNFYKELGLKDEKGYGFHVGMDNRDKDLVRSMVEKVKSLVRPKVEEHLEETQMFTASFVIKESNPQGVVPPHQDWSFVEDEKRHCSVSCWIPLQDVNMENGCIGVIRGSHRFLDSVRPSPSPQVGTPLKNHMYTIFPYLELLEMKAGEALFFDNRTFHASPPNTTDTPRIAVGLGFAQKAAEIRHYTLKPGTTDTLLKYKIDADFFLKYDNAALSRMYDANETIDGYELEGEVPYTWEDLTTDELKKLMVDAGSEFNIPLVETMAKLFGNQTQESKSEPEPVEEKQPELPMETVETEPSEPFWKVYTPVNVFKEVRFRLTGKS
jgi:ectoine hydroxylase-related dioxygenase (phytanoyl-CoA dioxygenase family)